MLHSSKPATGEDAARSPPLFPSFSLPPSQPLPQCCGSCSPLLSCSYSASAVSSPLIGRQRHKAGVGKNLLSGPSVIDSTYREPILSGLIVYR